MKLQLLNEKLSLLEIQITESRSSAIELPDDLFGALSYTGKSYYASEIEQSGKELTKYIRNELGPLVDLCWKSMAFYISPGNAWSEKKHLSIYTKGSPNPVPFVYNVKIYRIRNRYYVNREELTKTVMNHFYKRDQSWES